MEQCDIDSLSRIVLSGGLGLGFLEWVLRGVGKILTAVRKGLWSKAVCRWLLRGSVELSGFGKERNLKAMRDGRYLKASLVMALSIFLENS
ncbi:hypothetical protein L1049_026748 [Liquidambar formosana]|uniref:Uncharacterized protein n=1 Tax=Liquidambar formosana TaxID=63359 RepID=A0AAP0NHL2_LIQFO